MSVESWDGLNWAEFLARLGFGIALFGGTLNTAFVIRDYRRKKRLASAGAVDALAQIEQPMQQCVSLTPALQQLVDAGFRELVLTNPDTGEQKTLDISALAQMEQPQEI